jgi:hypothetical protein
MGSEVQRPNSEVNVPTSSTEVEFALALSRMIDSAKNDPEHLRATVYELARYKLKEQRGSEKPADFRQLSKALEVAIRGVEIFVKKGEQRAPALPRPGTAQQQRVLAVPDRDSSLRPAATVIKVGFERKKSKFRAAVRFIAVIAIGFAVVFAVKQRGITVEALQRQASRIAATIPRPNFVPQASQTPQTLQARTDADDHAPVQPLPLMPTTYGIYAVSKEKLYELESLPGRVPDMRVAVSPAISTSSKTTLPDGHLKFIVYRRDSATNAPDHAEIRLVAKVAQETTFNSAGKAVMAKVEDTWAIRNISIPFRTAPKKNSPDMYEVQSEDTEGALPPGRYALAIKGQAYDFSVGGEITDRRQCLERLIASNGQFYSECQKP